MSVEAAQANVARCRELARTDPRRHEPELGLALYELCMELRGGPITWSYLELLEEGIAIHRRLLRRNPNSVPQLGLMLGWLGFAKHSLGWYAEARDLLVEGLGLIRRMAQAQPELYENQLARLLSLVSLALSKTGDHDGAVTTARESVAMWRELVEDQPNEHEHDLGDALAMLCFALQDAGRYSEMRATTEESMESARRLVARDSGTRNVRHLANTLDLQAAALAHCDRHDDAFPLVEEAVGLYEKAIAMGDRRTSLNYATSLNNLSKAMLLRERRSDARKYAKRAFGECMMRVRDANSPGELSAAASDIAGMLSDLGMVRRSRILLTLVNQRLDPQPRGPGKLIARLRRR